MVKLMVHLGGKKGRIFFPVEAIREFTAAATVEFQSKAVDAGKAVAANAIKATEQSEQ